MRILVKIVGYAASAVVIAMVAQYAFTTSDNVLIGSIAAFLYGVITFGGLIGPAISARVFRYNKIAGLFVAAVTAACFIAAVSNEIEAMTERGDGQQAGRTLVADTVQDARRSLEQAEKDRRALVFTPANEAAVQAATAKASTATQAKTAECGTRGPRCREKEAAESQALADLASVTRDKALTDQAATLDSQITALRSEIKKAGPVLQTNSSGKAFTRLFGLPDTEAAKVATWKLGFMMIVAEFLIMALILASEVFDKHEKAPKRATEISEIEARREEETEAPAPIQVATRPHLVSSETMPFGNVAEIVSANIETAAGRSKASIGELHTLYVQVCGETGKRPVPNADFASAITAFCQAQGIATKQGDGDFFMLKVRIKGTEKKGARQ